MDQIAAGGGTAPPADAPVWDVFVRIFHWSLVATFAIAWITADDWDRLHEWVGYAATALVSARIIWGFVGGKHARFTDFIQSPRTIVTYLRDILRGTERRYLGHNPAGGAMIIALLLGICGLGLSGWMMTLDAYWGVDWVEELHEALSNIVIGLIVLHIGGVILGSFRHRENLIRAMFTGRKRAG